MSTLTREGEAVNTDFASVRPGKKCIRGIEIWFSIGELFSSKLAIFCMIDGLCRYLGYDGDTECLCDHRPVLSGKQCGLVTVRDRDGETPLSHPVTSQSQPPTPKTGEQSVKTVSHPGQHRYTVGRGNQPSLSQHQSTSGSATF